MVPGKIKCVSRLFSVSVVRHKLFLEYLLRGRNGTSITESPFSLRFFRGRWSTKAISTSSRSILSLELGTLAEIPTKELIALEPVVLVTITIVPENQKCNHDRDKNIKECFTITLRILSPSNG